MHLSGCVAFIVKLQYRHPWFVIGVSIYVVTTVTIIDMVIHVVLGIIYIIRTVVVKQ